MTQTGQDHGRYEVIWQKRDGQMAQFAMTVID